MKISASEIAAVSSHICREPLRTSTLKVAKAWQAKEVAMELWWPRRRSEIVQDFKAWCAWAKRIRLEPVRRAANMIAAHIEGIANAVGMALAERTTFAVLTAESDRMSFDKE